MLKQSMTAQRFSRRVGCCISLCSDGRTVRPPTTWMPMLNGVTSMTTVWTQQSMFGEARVDAVNLTRLQMRSLFI